MNLSYETVLRVAYHFLTIALTTYFKTEGGCSVATSGQQEERGKARLASGPFRWSEISRILCLPF